MAIDFKYEKHQLSLLRKLYMSYGVNLDHMFNNPMRTHTEMYRQAVLLISNHSKFRKDNHGIPK